MKQKFIMPTGEVREQDMPNWKTPYNHDRDFESERTALYTPEPSKTKQEFKEECDINTILTRFLKTGEPPPLVLPEHFADLSGRTTYYDIATKTAEANELFYLLPATKRAEFQNDPARWADAVVEAIDNGDRDLLPELGIQVPTPKPQEAQKPTPAGDGTPAPSAPAAPSGAPKAGETPAPPSDKGK